MVSGRVERTSTSRLIVPNCNCSAENLYDGVQRDQAVHAPGHHKQAKDVWSRQEGVVAGLARGNWCRSVARCVRRHFDRSRWKPQLSEHGIAFINYLRLFIDT